MSHLTEDQIDELLMGSLDPAVAAQMREHAAGCEICAAQLAEIEAPIAGFKAVTLAWSERRSATLPVRPTARPSGVRWATGLAWGSVAAAALLAAIIPVLRHEHNAGTQQARNIPTASQGTPQPTATAAPVTTQATASDNSAVTVVPENPQEIAGDNRMLAMVDAELNAPIVTPTALEIDRRPTPEREHSRQD